MNTQTKTVPAGKRLAANSVIVLSFIVALEFVIMISPFAFVFYAALNPFLLALNQLAFTRWLTAPFAGKRNVSAARAKIFAAMQTREARTSLSPATTAMRTRDRT